MSFQAYPKLPPESSAKDAVIWIRSITKWLGPGFHPDTPGDDYIRDHWSRTFTDAQAARYDQDMTHCFELLADEDRNPYDVAIKVQRRLLGFTR